MSAIVTHALSLMLEAARLAGLPGRSKAIDEALSWQEKALTGVDKAEAAQRLAITALNERELMMGLHKTLVDGSTKAALAATKAVAEAEADLAAANADFEVAMSKLDEALIAVLKALAAVVRPPGGAAAAIAWAEKNMTQECQT